MFELENLKKHKIYTIFIISLIIISVMVLNGFDSIEDYKQEKLDMEWSIIEDILRDSIDESHISNEVNVAYIQRKIRDHYEGNSEDLEYDIKHLYENNVLTGILAKSLRNDILFDMDENKSDANDPFYISRERIEINLSKDSALEFGEDASFTNEFTKHFNPILAQKAISNILDGNKEYTIWHYKTLDKELPFYQDVKNLEYVDVKTLKDLFYKHNGDYRVLKGFEFIVPEYIYRDKDLLGNKIVDSTGHKINNYQLILNQGFNIVDVLEHNSHLKYMRTIETDIEQYIERTVIRYVGMLIVFLIGFLGTALILNRKSR